MPIYDQMSGSRVDPERRPSKKRGFSTILPWRRHLLAVVCQRTSCDLLRPSPNQVRAGWAKDGDVEPLWRLLADSPWDRIDREDILRLLTQALEVQARAD